MACLLCLGKGGGLLFAEETAQDEPPKSEEVAKEDKKDEQPAKEADDPAPEPEKKMKDGVEVEEIDAAEEEQREAEAAVARPVNGDPVQVFGWREWVTLENENESQKLPAKLDTGALTSSLHCEEKHLFERDGRKWVRFVVTNPRAKESKRLQMEAPLVRMAHIKEPGEEDGAEARETVMLRFKIGERSLKAEFTLNNRSNMINPVLIGRKTITELGWVDPSRAYLADKKVLR
ncbi:ATP-dependent zinc protease family protein [Haloferula sargassicola]|uniref:Retropepsin-like aspartic endopeptidase domain-containing protein n=1 Tax=Haloferula sargassicola TaxID=490096 RepID=A0ABP9URY4_9BACT